jgi:hypothetical protein
MLSVILTLLACGPAVPDAASARSDFERLRPAIDDIRAQVETGLSAVSSYTPMDCTEVVEGMREMCLAQSAAQEQAADDQQLQFRKEVIDRLTARDDVIAVRCLQGDTVLGGAAHALDGASKDRLSVDDYLLQWGTFDTVPGLLVRWDIQSRNCQLYLGR